MVRENVELDSLNRELSDPLLKKNNFPTIDGAPDTSDDAESTKNPTFYNGHCLPPKIRGQIPYNLRGCPTLEIDPYYKNTFVTLGKGSGILYRFDGNALTENDGWRRQTIAILSHGVFNYFMVVVVLINLITLAVIPPNGSSSSENTLDSETSPEESGTETESNTSHFSITYYLNWGFLWIYALEFGLKVIARGLFHPANKFSTLMITWSWLDLIIIADGIRSVIDPSNEIFNVLSALRALKLIPLLPSWLAAYDLMLKKTVRSLLGVIYVAIVNFLLLGIFGCALYGSNFSWNCVLDDALAEEDENFSNESIVLYIDGSQDEPRLCGNYTWSEACPENYTCQDMTGKRVLHNYATFHTFPRGLLALVNVVVQDYAEFMYDKIWATNGPFHIVYFVLCFVLGTFTLGTLVYAVIVTEFQRGWTQYMSQWTDSTCRVGAARNTENVSKTGWRTSGKKFFESSGFDMFMTIVILLDIICLAFNGPEYMTPPSLCFFLTTIVIPLVYVTEAGLKLIFLGPKNYFSRCWNIFDLLIVILLLFDFITVHGVFFRTLTVFKIIPRWTALNNFMKSFRHLFWGSGTWIFGFISIYVFFYAYVGCVTFGKLYYEKPDAFPRDEIPGWNMINMHDSIRLFVRVIAGEWNEALWDVLRISSTLSGLLLMVTAGLLGNFLVKVLGTVVVLSIINSPLETRQRTSSTLTRLTQPFTLVLNKIVKFIGSEQAETETASKNPWVLDSIMIHFSYSIFSCILLIVLFGLDFTEYEFPAQIVFVVVFALDLIGRIANSCKGQWKKIIFQIGFLWDVILVVNGIIVLSLTLPQGIGRFKLLMIVSRVKQLRIVSTQLWEELKAIVGPLLSTLFIWYAFILIGMHCFMQEFYECVDAEHIPIDYRVISGKDECLANNLSWVNSNPNFDTSPNGLWALIVLGNRNGWLQLITDIENTVTVGFQPAKGSNPWSFLYVVAFLIFGVVLPVYSIFGSLIQSLTKRWTEIFGNTQSEISGITSEGQSDSGLLGKFVGHPLFENWVALTIFVDAIAYSAILSVDYAEAIFPWQILQIVILVLYIGELILRLAASKAKKAFWINWLNILLLIVVVTSIIELVMVEVAAENVIGMGMLRSLRLFHLFTLDGIGNFIKFKFLKVFRESWKKVFPVLFWLLLFYTLIFASFTSFGFEQFGNHGPSGKNFASYNSLKTTFRIATISGIDDIYRPIARFDQYDCDFSNDEPCIEHDLLGAVYISSLILATILCFANAYIALIMELVHGFQRKEPARISEENGRA